MAVVPGQAIAGARGRSEGEAGKTGNAEGGFQKDLHVEKSTPRVLLITELRWRAARLPHHGQHLVCVEG